MRVDTPTPGLVAVWPFDDNGNDVIGGHDGTAGGSGTVFESPAVWDSCASLGGAESICLLDHFFINIQWRTNPTPGAPFGNYASPVGFPNPGSGLFWFFNANNWEVLVKVINACTGYNHYWVFSAATTNVFYRLSVTDVRAGETKVYFNYPGPPAPAVTDTAAFATCP